MPMDEPPRDITMNEEAFGLLDRYLQDLHEGRQPESNSLLQRHPELASMLRCLEGLNHLAAPPNPATQAADSRVTIAHRASAMLEGAGAPNGELDFGNFELLGEIGRGGMGVIWKARQKDLDRIVAIKMILANHLASPVQVERFVAEAKTMAKLHHPNIVRIHETGQVAGQHYFVMEYIAGSSLAERARAGTVSPEKAARYVCTIARAVAHLHAQGIVHRDLKPSNILLDENDEPYVTDFGLVKMLGAGSQATTTGAILGTPAYMAPEQAAGQSEKVGPLSDVYSLGAILYDLVTGRPPFQETNPLDTLVQVIEGEPTRPCWVNPAIPPKLEMICLKCLEKAPEDRYASAAGVADDLERFLNGEDVEARPANPWALFRRWARREPSLVFRLCALLVFVCIVQVNYTILPLVSKGLHLEVLKILGLWMVASLACQWLVNRRVWVGWMPSIWSGVDAVLLTLLLRVTNTQNSPLLIGYPFLVAVSGLWFQVRPVWVTTAVLEASYVYLVLDCSARGGAVALPHFHVIFMVALAVLAWAVAYQVQRIRVLSRYYEHRPLPE
ncbi:MAG: serine/threonine protein kinase [Gemmataceae bacterium]|nr:serine/threonine protein kinase [Gemmataceae bacterium]